MNAIKFHCQSSPRISTHPCAIFSIVFFLMMVVSGASASLSAQTIRLPQNFNWQQIPASYAGKTLEVIHPFSTPGLEIQLPQNSTLRFNGGSISGAKSITGNNTRILNPSNKPIFDLRTHFTGNFAKTVATPEWFGAKGDNTHNDAPALDALLRNFRTIHLSGSYFITKATIQILHPVSITGSVTASIRGDGAADTRFIVKNSLTIHNIRFSNFRFCFLFDHDAMIRDIKVTNCRFTDIEKPIYASNSNLKQTLTHIEIKNNHFQQCTAGVELLARVRYVTVCDNTFQNLGNKTLAAQSNAIRLGNTAINFLTDTTMGDFVIAGNTITEVYCGINTKGGEGYECHAIFATGKRIEILNNQIRNVYNGGSGSNPRNKTGSEAIYVKANHCTIAGNTILNAGYGEGAICAKGFGLNLVIKENNLRYTENLADNPQLITCYYSGSLLIQGNTFESTNPGTTTIKLCAQGPAPSYAIITKNNGMNIHGYALRIYNRQPDAIIEFAQNNITFEGDFLKEESVQPYALTVNGNIIRITNGSFLPASKTNHLTFTYNNVKVIGKTSMANLWRTHRIENNRFEVNASLPELPLFVMHGNARFSHNVVIVEGAFRNILMFVGDTATHISGNRFALSGKQGKADRVIFINTATSNLPVRISNNTFVGNPVIRNISVITVSNAGASALILENNTADKHTGIFTEFLAPVTNATFTANKTQSPAGFISENSLQKIRGKWSAARTEGIPGNKTGN
jgi:hypothetical protein